jgi:ABC-2 type transport system ATP-binding protein
MNESPPDTNVVLRADHLSKTYGQRPALLDFSCEVKTGEIVGLLGPNGAGKTTTIRILTTILPATTGSFTLLGVPDSRPEEIRALIGVVPESNGFPRAMTGEDFLIYMGRLYGLSKAEASAKARELLAVVRLSDSAQRRIHTYSLGMRRRLSIARALVNAPSLLLLDEPTLGIDPIGHREILQVIQQAVAAQHVAVILSSHQLEVVEKICTRVLILNRGRVIAEGPVAEIKRRVAVPQTCRIQVDVEAVPNVQAALTALDTVDVSVNSSAGNEIVVVSKDTALDMNTILHHLIQQGIVIEAFTRDTISLSDAFLSMIEGGEIG